MSEEILYVKKLSVSDSDAEAEMTNEDVWDDRKLNEAYDKALRIANAEVARRIAMSTNTPPEGKEGETKNKPGKSSATKPSSKNCKKGPKSWREGMACRAVYEDDGMEYEAIICRIVSEKECLVKFVGYNNSQVVQISTLKPSLGRKAQDRQIVQSNIDNGEDLFNGGGSPGVEPMECPSDISPSPQPQRPEQKSQDKRKKSSKKKKINMMQNSFDQAEMPFAFTDIRNLHNMRNFTSRDLPLMPPPVPPAHLPRASDRDADEQALSSMLISWYMSGYYTGLYTGMKRTKGSGQRSTSNT